MSSLSDFDYINTLLLTYGELLTDKQKEIANLFFEFILKNSLSKLILYFSIFIITHFLQIFYLL